VIVKTQLKILFYLFIILAGFAVMNLLVEFDYLSRKTEEPVWELAWSDDFDESGVPNDELWEYSLGDGCPNLCGWGNNELQTYTSNQENIRIENGRLIIQIQSDTSLENKYTSAKLMSLNNKGIKYGKIEVSAINPSGNGTWPAIWMLPTEKVYGGWPKSGEIDIMEHVGYSPDSIIGTVHTESYNHINDTQKSGSVVLPDNEYKFHKYEIQWTPEKIDFLVDDKSYFTFVNENKTSDEWPYDQEFRLILNLAVGGNWGGKHGVDDKIVGEQFVIDYVRVYEDKSPKRLF